MNADQPVALRDQIDFLTPDIAKLILQIDTLGAAKLKTVGQCVLVLLLELQNDRPTADQFLIEPGDFLFKEIQGLTRRTRAHFDILGQDHRDHLIGDRCRKRRSGGLEADGHQRRLGRAAFSGITADRNLDALAQISNDFIGVAPGTGRSCCIRFVSVDVQLIRHFQQRVPRQNALLNDLQLFRCDGPHCRGGQIIGDLLALDDQRRLGYKDRRQDLRQRQPQSRAGHRDQQKIRQAPHEEQPVKTEVHRHITFAARAL